MQKKYFAFPTNRPVILLYHKCTEPGRDLTVHFICWVSGFSLLQSKMQLLLLVFSKSQKITHLAVRADSVKAWQKPGQSNHCSGDDAERLHHIEQLSRAFNHLPQRLASPALPDFSSTSSSGDSFGFLVLTLFGAASSKWVMSDEPGSNCFKTHSHPLYFSSQAEHMSSIERTHREQ